MFRTNVFHTVIAAALLVTTAAALASPADAQGVPVGNDPFAVADSAAGPDQASERLMIVNRNTGRVIYDDGHNDLFCVTRLYVAGYNDWGRPIYRRSMRCR